MALLKLEDFDPNYRETFEGDDVKGLGVYAEGDEKIGTVSDVLVDENGHFRYLVVDLGFWIFGKKVLLPIGRTRIDYNADRVYAIGMTREQAENLPEYSDRMTADYDYEERVRGVYRTQPVEASAPVDTTADYSTYDRNSYNYDREPNLYGLNDRDHQTFRLYEERLIANKNRYKAGEVAVGKRIETETARVSVPIEKERVVIERVTPTDAGTVVNPGEVAFQEGEVARVELYEETPDIHKEAFVREEVRVRKVVDRDTVEAQETIRREELDVNTDGTPVVEQPGNTRSDLI
ncbi:MAG TPA: photosystem reaction center subunit H [Cyanobacteria bacterium UBA11371]|nr:photosystem reaction center subunit H [Cyanobacteria bacterium UBA11371]HBE36011.1 photosystem reaction center subunit H [Cyanobacteria bacterium UBA11368]